MKIDKIHNGNINDVYVLENNENKYIIRISAFDNSFECKILKLLEKQNFNSPKLLTNFCLENKNFMICKYIEGDNPKVFDNYFYIYLSGLLKALHSIKNNYKKNEYVSNEESFDKLKEYYQVAIHSKYLLNEQLFINDIYMKILKLDLDAMPKHIIHSDIKKENLIISDNKLYLIDFGNVYIGNRIIDLVRIIMWFFIKPNNLDYKTITDFITNYFENNQKLLKQEQENLDLLIKYCIFYNLMKDIALYERKILKSNYIDNNSIIWLKILKQEKVLTRIRGAFDNA